MWRFGRHQAEARWKVSFLSPALLQCFDVLRAVIHSKPTREFEVFPQPHLRFCVASDAALEVPKAGTGGFLIVWFSTCDEIREGFVADIPEAIYDLWSPGPHKIAQLELMMVLYALVTRAASFRNRRGVWWWTTLQPWWLWSKDGQSPRISSAWPIWYTPFCSPALLDVVGVHPI